MTPPRDVVFSPEAEPQIVALYEYLSGQVSPTIGASYTGAIVDRCEQFGEMPLTGIA